MNREIKFRIPMFTDKGTFTEFQYLKLGDDIEGTLAGYNGEPQQYTGLKDKNGKEIYEGDILATPHGSTRKIMYSEICWDNSRSRWAAKMYNPRSPKQSFAYSKSMAKIEMKSEIIGNIYQNPELTKNNE